MKHENLFKIYIPEPCHEDWGKMTPNEQGAFCKVCSKTVVDFSVKTQNEIQKFLGENLEKKICGRFKSDQLNETPRLKIQPPKFEFPKFLFPLSFSPVRTYTMAVLLFASVALASCGNSETEGNNGWGSGEGDSIHVMVNGGLEVMPVKDTVKENKEINENYNHPDLNTMGGLSYKQVKTDSVRVDSAAFRMVGEVSIQIPKDSVQNNTDSVKVNNNHIKMGMVKKTETLKGDVQFEK
jgi:hypothetical protein